MNPVARPAPAPRKRNLGFMALFMPDRYFMLCGIAAKRFMA